MSEINSNEHSYVVPQFDFSILSEEFPPVIDGSTSGSSLEEPSVLDTDFTPKMPRKDEIEHWNSRLRRSKESLEEEPTSNSLFSTIEQRKIQKAREKLEINGIEEPTNEQIANRIPARSNHDLKTYIHKHGVEELRIDDLSEDDIAVTDEYFEEIEQDVYLGQLKTKVDDALKSLKDNEKAAVTGYIMEEGATLESVGKTMGVSKERVRQLNNKALERLRHSSLGLKSFENDNDSKTEDDKSGTEPTIRSSFNVFGMGVVQLEDRWDDRPYEERIQEYCESDTNKWVNSQKERLENDPSPRRPDSINRATNNVDRELGELKKIHSRIIKRGDTNDPFHNSSLAALNIRIFVLDGWKSRLAALHQNELIEGNGIDKNLP